ncbi:hypothetical protein PV327_001687 [Microctonus hyperodae]|uniref:C3H1-type domain-containing protein n=1 Tax=Microctonus hyperodae TaxID=165561 RepID=A0AA39KND7_MICHY|nr:hypothetical protein PV327_001687 [Microctonus hyperodae]
MIMTSNADNDDLEDGEIPSDEDDEPIVPIAVTKLASEPSKTSSSSPSKSESSRGKSLDSKSSKSKKSSSSTTSSSGGSKSDRFGKYKNPSEDWAGDVEKAIRAVLEQDRSKNQDSKSSRSKSSSRSRSRKRTRDDKEEDRAKEQKRRRLSEEENGNEDDDEMLFVRGASPVRREIHDSSPPLSRRSHERENFDNNSDRDSEERSSRHRDSDKRSSGRGITNRRGAKNDRGSKNKTRGQLRNERNGRRNQSSDHNNQDPDAICLYYMQGKCHRGDDCPFSHNAMPPRKMELCKFYLMDCCAKRDKCLYMHHDFPCKFFHTGLKCNNGDNCKFSHEPLNEQVKNILLKHLETAPKEILGDFPRLSREGALMMINNTARNLAEGHDTTTQKIPSLFDVTLTAPTTNSSSEKDEDSHVTLNSMESPQLNHQKRSSSSSIDRKPAGKKTRWGSDEDRVPLEQIMLLQSVSQLGLHLPNVALSLAVQQQLQQRILLQQCIANMEFYNEIQGSPTGENDSIKLKEKDNTSNDIDTMEARGQQIDPSSAMSKDIDLRQLLTTNGPKSSSVVSIADEAANLSQSKFDDESDHDEESDLVIAVPTDEDDKNKDKTSDNLKEKEAEIEADDSTKNISSMGQGNNSDEVALTGRVIPPNLPKAAQELFLRIQQQQRIANESISNIDEKHTIEPDAVKSQEDWYSEEDEDRENDDDDDDDDDDDEDGGNLQIVIKDNFKDESERSDNESPTKEPPVIQQDLTIPQPAVIVDKLGDLSKIDISAEVTKLLSSIKPHQSGSSSKKDSKIDSTLKDDVNKNKDSIFDHSMIIDKTTNVNSENETGSPRASTKSGSTSRDPRMSRDPRQRRVDEAKSSGNNQSELKKENQSLRQETSIYSSGITAMDVGMDTDLRARVDQDHRRQDMDFRQRYQQDFGDTDLRVVATGFPEGSTRSDVDLRQMLSLPFKPAPSHVPCTEIDASIASHSQVTYKVYVVDIPRPNYTGLKLTKNDALVKYDPRLRKIFRLSQMDIADSPMSPPPVKPDTPKSPPQIRVDPRRKAMEGVIHTAQNIGSSGMMSNVMGPQQSQQDLSIGMPGPGMQIPSGMSMPLGPNQMMGNMGAMGPIASMMSGNMQPPNVPPMGMGSMGNMPPGMGPNGPPMGPNQMGYDQQRYNVQRNGGPGLLGPAPRLGFPDPRDMGPNYDAPPFPSSNYGNFGPGPGPNEPMMGYGPNGPNNMNFGVNGPDWNPGNQNPMRRGGRVRRRNRNRANNGGRSNRSPP